MIYKIIIIILLSTTTLVLLYKGVQIIRQLIAGYGIPNVTSEESVSKTLINEINLSDNDTFVDLGAGEGNIIALISQTYPNTTCIGYELAPQTYKLAQRKKQSNRGHYHLYHQNFFKADLSNATHIYCFLMPHLMKKIRRKITKECKPGTKLFVNAFPIPNQKPQKQIGNLYMYTV